MPVDPGSLRRAIRGLQLARSKTAETMNEKVFKFCQAVLRRSNFYCPVDTGVLRRSGEVVKRGGKGLQRYEVRYTAPYAIYVHEDMTKKHAEPTQAKFLERAVQEMAVDFTAKYGKDDQTFETLVEVK